MEKCKLLNNNTGRNKKIKYFRLKQEISLSYKNIKNRQAYFFIWLGSIQQEGTVHTVRAGERAVIEI